MKVKLENTSNCHKNIFGFDFALDREIKQENGF